MKKHWFGLTEDNHVEWDSRSVNHRTSFFPQFNRWEKFNAERVNADITTSHVLGLTDRKVAVLAFDFANTAANYWRKVNDSVPYTPALVLSGRDCFLPFVVLQRRTSFPESVLRFVPELSRSVAGNARTINRVVQEYKLRPTDVYVDTGFAGSIFNKLGQYFGIKQNYYDTRKLPHSRLLSTNSRQRYETLLLRDEKGRDLYAENKALRSATIDLEDSPKFWMSAYPEYYNYERSKAAIAQNIETNPDQFREASKFYHLMCGDIFQDYKSSQFRKEYSVI